jgi:hypothetical protein
VAFPQPLEADRRKFVKDPNAPNFAYKRAEDIPGYQRFTLDEVVRADKVSAKPQGMAYTHSSAGTGFFRTPMRSAAKTPTLRRRKRSTPRWR